MECRHCCKEVQKAVVCEKCRKPGCGHCCVQYGEELRHINCNFPVFLDEYDRSLIESGDETDRIVFRLRLAMKEKGVDPDSVEVVSHYTDYSNCEGVEVVDVTDCFVWSCDV